MLIMEGVGFYKHGGPEVLKRIDAPDPIPGNRDVVVGSIATSVNRIDILSRVGYHGLEVEMPHFPGSDIIGIVEKVGRDVDNVSVGEKVTANNTYGCGKCQACRSGDATLCADWKMIGLDVNGTYASMVKIPASSIFRPPKRFSDYEIASMSHNMTVVWRALRTIGKVSAGEVVVIRGASGNAGIFAVMIAKALKMKVVALSRNSEKRRRLRQLGADLTLNPKDGKEHLKKAVLDFTDGKGADIVIESFGATAGESIEWLRPGGRAVVFGSIAGTQAKVSVPSLYLNGASILGTHNASTKDFSEAFEFAVRHNIRPIIARVMDISQAKIAQTMLEQAEPFGKIILKHW